MKRIRFSTLVGGALLSLVWIDDRDVRSKRAFTFLMLFFSLAETGQPSAAPLVTISK